ncbi:immunoglobulin-like domain-containing protein [Mesobacillus sp. S13]|uniref:immunoglobulin-like domain-containing protein n=1 Tax=Mesobacillus sp. S13 TaxID=2880221 RepID=UPI00299D19DE|nr:immunoglobulin-like domain-containing protein [Mesobacillus sp. S13]
MRSFSKIISLTVIITLLLNFLPRQLFQNNITSIQSVNAAVHLTREDAEKYEGIVSAETSMTVLMVEDGTVVASSPRGNNETTQWTNIVSVASGNQHTLGLKKDGTAVATGNDAHGRLNVSEWSNLVDIAAGAEHSVGLKADGTVVAVGNDRNGQLGLHHWEGIVDIAAGARHTVGVKSDGTVVAVGDTQNGQTQVGDWTDIVSVAAGFAHTVGLKMDGTVVATGLNDHGQTNVSSWSDIVSIVTGESYTVGLKADGTVVATGFNEDGQIDVGEWKDVVAIAASVWHTVGLKADGTLVATGDNWNGQTDVQGWQDIVDITGNGQFTVGLKYDGTIVTKGVNYNGQLDLADWKDITKVEAGSDFTVGLKKDGTVIGTRLKSYDKGQTDVSEWRDIIDISAGRNFTVGLKRDGTVVATGDNYYGQLNVSEWTDIVAISAGSNYTVGLKADGSVITTGYPGFAMWDVNNWKDIIAISAGLNHTVGLKADGTVLTVKGYDYELGDVSDWTEIVDIYAGGGNTLGIKKDGTVVGTGEFWDDARTTSNWKDIVALTGRNSIVGLKKDGTVIAIGPNSAGEISVVPLRHTLEGIVSSYDISKSVGASGDTITVAVHFTKSVKAGVKIALRGAMASTPKTMTEVAGSDGKTYEYTFTVPENASGKVHFHLSDVIDNESGFEYQDQYANNLFTIDGEAPSFYGIEDTSINVHSDFNPLDGVNAYDFIEGNLTAEIELEGDVDPSKMGDYVVIYKVTDTSGNTSETSRTITVADKGEPVLTGVEDLTLEAVDSFDVLEGVAATDNVDGDLTEKIEVTGTVEPLKPGVYVVHYSVTDAAGNTEEAERKITVVDTVGPVISGADDKTINMHSAFDPAEGVEAIDVVDGDMTSNLLIYGTVNPDVKGKYTLTYIVNDITRNETELNRTITVIDTIKPVISGVEDLTIKMGADFDLLAGVRATDNADGDLTEAIQINGEVDTKVKGTYTLTYTVTDTSGNSESVTRTVHVIDQTAPVITGTVDQTIKAGTAFNPLYGVKATDNADGDITSLIVVNGTVNTSVAGSYTLTYTSIDSSGNTAKVEREITVIKSGWLKENGYWFYYDTKTGIKKTGWLLDGAKWYYLDASGVMKTGWVLSGGKWYFLEVSGAMKTGWLKSGTKWYYLQSSGAMKTGWLKDGGKWYYLENSGAMKTGWLKSGGKWYYLESSGVMKTGWVKSGSKWYYLYSSGAMAYNTTIGGYKLGADGAWIQ